MCECWSRSPSCSPSPHRSSRWHGSPSPPGPGCWCATARSSWSTPRPRPSWPRTDGSLCWGLPSGCSRASWCGSGGAVTAWRSRWRRWWAAPLRRSWPGGWGICSARLRWPARCPEPAACGRRRWSCGPAAYCSSGRSRRCCRCWPSPPAPTDRLAAGGAASPPTLPAPAPHPRRPLRCTRAGAERGRWRSAQLGLTGCRARSVAGRDGRRCSTADSRRSRPSSARSRALASPAASSRCLSARSSTIAAATR